MTKQPARVTLDLPEEFQEMCECDMVPARSAIQAQVPVEQP
jgi:hypothetical protein